MVQMSQTSWQEYSITNVLETLRYAPMNLRIGTDPVIFYTLPKEVLPGEVVSYRLQNGFRVLKWTGIVSSVSDNTITVRLGEGPFRGFNAKHCFVSEDSLTACYDEMSFQGFVSIAEESFAAVMKNANLVYCINARKETRSVMLAIESQKTTQSFTSLDQSATAG